MVRIRMGLLELDLSKLVRIWGRNGCVTDSSWLVDWLVEFNAVKLALSVDTFD
jgi:hypothetical protein